jgi:hypothetical protein
VAGPLLIAPRYQFARGVGGRTTQSGASNRLQGTSLHEGWVAGPQSRLQIVQGTSLHEGWVAGPQSGLQIAQGASLHEGQFARGAVQGVTLTFLLPGPYRTCGTYKNKYIVRLLRKNKNNDVLVLGAGPVCVPYGMSEGLTRRG